MSRRVTLPPTKRPERYVPRPCPCCGHVRAVINGRWLADRRQRARLDQRALARTLGVSGPYLSDIERNRREAPEAVIAAYLELAV